MKKLNLMLMCLTIWHFTEAQNVGIGTTTPAASAQLEVSSTTKSFLMPRMTTAQRDSIVSPVVGLQIFNLDDQCTDLYDGTNWIKACGLKVVSTITDSSHPTPDSWTKKANFGGMARYAAVGFSIGSKGYIGTGIAADGRKKDFWEYDPKSNAWTQKEDFGGTARESAVGFSIAKKGYIGTGTDGSRKNDFWEYDPALNLWTVKAAFPGGPRQEAIGFSIGSKGYIGTGTDGIRKNDFWEYDPTSNIWTEKADFGGKPRQNAVGFSIGNKGYVGTGFSFFEENDFWEYDPANNTWTSKAPFAGDLRQKAVGFSIGSKGYVGTGWFFFEQSDFWQYDPATNNWIQKAGFGGGGVQHAVGFSIGNKGYVGTGLSNVNKNDFWQYMDNNQTGSAYSSNLLSSIGNSITDGAWTLANETVYNANNGNVGIGTSTPDSKLDVVGSIKASATVTAGGLSTAGIVTNTASGLLGTTSIVGVANGGTGTNAVFSAGSIPFAGANGIYTQNNANLFWNNTAARLGIGTASPIQTLDVNGRIRISNGVIQNGNTPVTGTGDLGLYSQTAGTWMRFVTNNAPMVFFTENGIGGAGNTPRMVLKENGRLGIGTDNPDAPLHINGSGMTTPNVQRSFFVMGSNTGGFPASTSTSGNIQVHANGWYWADGGGFVSTSDARIKNIIGKSNSSMDMEILNSIEITDYRYKDEISHGSGLQKKVIAQQLKSVYPIAVNNNKGVVPGIFEKAVKVNTNGKKTTITLGKQHNLATDDVVKLILEQGGEKILPVTVTDAFTFQVNESITDNVFVYGKLVNDLLNVDYDAISMLNVSATQELYKQLKKLQEENATYKARINDIETKLNALLKTTAAHK